MTSNYSVIRAVVIFAEHLFDGEAGTLRHSEALKPPNLKSEPIEPQSPKSRKYYVPTARKPWTPMQPSNSKDPAGNGIQGRPHTPKVGLLRCGVLLASGRAEAPSRPALLLGPQEDPLRAREAPLYQRSPSQTARHDLSLA